MGRAIYGIMGNLSEAASLEKPTCFLFAVISCQQLLRQEWEFHHSHPTSMLDTDLPDPAQALYM